MQDGPESETTALRTVAVPLGARSYDIKIGPGLLAESGALIASLARGAKCAVVTDGHVAPLYGEILAESLARAGLAASQAVLPPGESSKSFARLEELCGRLLDCQLERGDAVIALGGGVIGDLAGFAASILKRGTRLVQIPTTLLAQVDSSVGGKTGINTRHGKNLIGAFHQPSLVIADTSVLDTLSPRQFRAGYAEVAKYGLLGDAAFFGWLEQNWRDVFGSNGAARLTAIETSCRAKAALVAEDEREMGRRALLNLGHTFGHALEAWAGYSDRLLHGEAIAIGMVLAFEASEELGYCRQGASGRVAAHLKAAGLPVRIADMPRGTNGQAPDATTLLGLIAQDKKVKRGTLTLILARDIGEAFVQGDVDAGWLGGFLDARCTV